MSYAYQWIHREIKTHKDLEDMRYTFQTVNPEVGAFDTETTGLHIIHDRPFMVQFGILDPGKKRGYVWVIDLEICRSISKSCLNTWFHDLAPRLRWLMGHNITFDLHMLENIGYKLSLDNLLNTQAYIRYASDAVGVKEGGPPTGLKEFSKRFLDGAAGAHDKLIQRERTDLAKKYNEELRAEFYGKVTKEEKQSINSILSKDTFEVEDLPHWLKKIYRKWFKNLPRYLQYMTVGYVSSYDISYRDVRRDLITEYAGMDIQLTLETWLKCAPVVTARENLKGIFIESKLILPIVGMERTGLKVDKGYLHDCKARMRSYINQRQEDLWKMLGKELNTGQHQKIRETFSENWSVELKGTSKEYLNQIKNDLPEGAKETVEVLEELRTLNKWYSTYLLRFRRELRNTDRIYTQLNSTGTVSGRFTSDFQQFPKYSILDNYGNELFHPRKMVITEPDYPKMIFLDYSQIELRLQAMYTILCDNPDMNLCRAYMPYKCHNEQKGEFDYNNPEHLNNAYTLDWRLDEDPQKSWTPTDIHAVTTKGALGIDETHPDWKLQRTQVGKVLNFMKNYGGSKEVVRRMFPDKSEEEIEKIDSAYYKAFPGVKTYHNYCYERANGYSNTENLFGIRYYNVTGHKLINLLIQGSAAFLLKQAMIEIWNYLEFTCRSKGRSKMAMSIHDELVFYMHKDDDYTTFEHIKILMETLPGALVPIVVDAEITETNWAEKKPMEAI